jgi:ATP-dependent DNA helicase RecG
MLILASDKAQLIETFQALPAETEWLEFKENTFDPQTLGDYLSALSNSARLKEEKFGFLVFGIHDKNHSITGTTFRPYNEKYNDGPPLITWIINGLEPRVALDISEGLYKNKYIVIFKIQAAIDRPTKFYGKAFVRVGSSKAPLAAHPELERRLWRLAEDWSAQLCPRATYDHLDTEALAKARAQFQNKHPQRAAEVEGWDNHKFLTKARVAIEGELTNAAILLLGKEEAEPLLAPAQAWLRWSLKKADGGDENYEDFRTPLIISVDRLFAKVRNLKVRYLPDGTLFPIEVDQYDSWVIREALHNAIAHQDYSLRGRVLVVEKPDELIFSNLGDFIPGTVEKVIREDVPPRLYRNPFLCQAMVNLGMIDTQGGGIRRMFLEQKKRCFPMPEFDLSRPGEVRVHVPGKIINSSYTKLLIENPDIELETAILLDRVQREQELSRAQYDFLRKQKLVEGRWNAYHLAANVAATLDVKADYIKKRGLDSKYYEDLLIEYIKKFGQASRKDIENLLIDKLPEVLNDKQKKYKIHNLLTYLKKEGKIVPDGVKRSVIWKIK